MKNPLEELLLNVDAEKVADAEKAIEDKHTQRPFVPRLSVQLLSIDTSALPEPLPRQARWDLLISGIMNSSMRSKDKQPRRRASIGATVSPKQAHLQQQHQQQQQQDGILQILPSPPSNTARRSPAASSPNRNSPHHRRILFTDHVLGQREG
jgi:hypothetical protein